MVTFRSKRGILVLDILPYYAFKKWVLFHLLNSISSQSLCEIFCQELFDEIACYSRNSFFSFFRPVDIEIMNILDDFLNGVSTKGSCPNEKFIRYDSKTPPIYRLIFSRYVVDNFRSYVIGSTDQIGSLDVFEGECHSPLGFLFFLVG